MKTGLDKNGNSFGVFRVDINVARDEQGAWSTSSSGFANVDGSPIDMVKTEQLLSTRILLAQNRITVLGIRDEDLRETVLEAGKASRVGRAEDYDAVINIADAAAAEQQRRDAARATPAPPALPNSSAAQTDE